MKARATFDLQTAAFFALALLVALASLGGLLLPATYARETASWAAQAVGQDWVDLVVASPWLIVAGLQARRGSDRALLLGAGGVLYVVYEFVIYGLAVHFNALFLVYCATLGVAFFTLGGLVLRLARQDWRARFGARAPVRLAGGFLIGVGVLFALLWLSEIVPALAGGTLPASTAEAGAVTNPVHVMDLSVVLPLHVLAGVALLRRRSLGFLLAPVILAFGVLMALSIGGMMLVMRARGADASVPVMVGMVALSGVTAAVLVALLRRLPPSTR